MREVLTRWIAHADTARYVERFGLDVLPESVAYLAAREDDLFIALVGELFDRMRDPDGDSDAWAVLANAFAEYGAPRVGRDPSQRVPRDTALFAAAAFYMGGFSASAYLMLRSEGRWRETEGQLAAYELLARPQALESERVRSLIDGLRRGSLDAIQVEGERANELVVQARAEGPEEWVGERLYQELVQRFVRTNIRRVLPDEQPGFWDPLVDSLLRRSPPVWDFFPSQIEAIERGLLAANETFSLQMPTGAGKTALTETIIFSHLTRHPDDVAVLLVPYRALAAELSRSLVVRFNRMGLNSTALYGGTVPTGDAIHALENLRTLVATPETLSGLLSADQSFFHRISLVVCDEGHLLDGGARGVGLELLLARMRARDSGAPRFVFVSAIVPNIEEINAWLGGTNETVVRSDYRPALAEFARLDPRGSGRNLEVALRFHPHSTASFVVDSFLRRDDFQFRNPTTGNLNTYAFTSIKTQAVATARKALAMGAVAVFAANKRGNQGCIGLAEELLNQLARPLSMAQPTQFVNDQPRLQQAVEYLTLEFGAEWLGTQVLEAGAVVHHGDIPQEAREVLEELVRRRVVPLAFCTSTLAEGVNLPIRTIVLYSVQRRSHDGTAENLLSRDIKNLVGRAGRAGSSTRGLVVGANPRQWPLIDPVARQAPGEPVYGALGPLLQALHAQVLNGVTLTNDFLESQPELYTLIDGVDATLIDLATEELKEDQLATIARGLAAETYAARIVSVATTSVMEDVFELRARRVSGVQAVGRLPWVRETGTRVRMLDLVERDLVTARDDWGEVATPTSPEFVGTMLEWAWSLRSVADAAREAYRDDDVTKEDLQQFVGLWLEGRPLGEIATEADLEIDDALAVHARVITYELTTAIEQGIALLRRFLAADGREASLAVALFPEHLRYGVPNAASRYVASVVRHRRAAVALGLSDDLRHVTTEDRGGVLTDAGFLLMDRERWLPPLGRLVYENTRRDLSTYFAGLDDNGE
jgi:helicase